MTRWHRRHEKRFTKWFIITLETQWAKYEKYWTFYEIIVAVGCWRSANTGQLISCNGFCSNRAPFTPPSRNYMLLGTTRNLFGNCQREMKMITSTIVYLRFSRNETFRLAYAATNRNNGLERYRIRVVARREAFLWSRAFSRQVILYSFSFDELLC